MLETARSAERRLQCREEIVHKSQIAPFNVISVNQNSEAKGKLG